MALIQLIMLTVFIIFVFYFTEIVRGENSVVINNGRYTPSAVDRSGFKVKCTDTKNPDWRAIDDIEHVIDVTPICQ